MAETKTKPTEISVDSFIEAVPNPERRADAKTLRAMLERVTGEPARMWGPTIIGFGTYHYKYASGHEGDMCRLGFSPRAKELVLYFVLDGHAELLGRLGKHRTSKACVYVKRLADVDEDVLEAWVVSSLEHMREKYPDGA